MTAIQSGILALLPRHHWYYPVTLADIYEASSRVCAAYNVPQNQSERLFASLCERFGIRRIVPTCISLARLETFFAREGHETAVAVRKAMRAGF